MGQIAEQRGIIDLRFVKPGRKQAAGHGDALSGANYPAKRIVASTNDRHRPDAAVCRTSRDICSAMHSNLPEI
jgi:hypothetical protein